MIRLDNWEYLGGYSHLIGLGLLTITCGYCGKEDRSISLTLIGWVISCNSTSPRLVNVLTGVGVYWITFLIITKAPNVVHREHVPTIIQISACIYTLTLSSIAI